MSVNTPLGQVLRDGEGMRLEFVRRYDAPREEVWSALTESDRTARWIGTWSGDPASGSVDFVMTAEGVTDSQAVPIVECLPPERLVLDLPSPDGTWRVSLKLTPAPGGTELMFTQRLAEPYDASSVGVGWHYYLDRLGAVVAGTDVPAEWDDYYPALAGSYALPA